jgi:hypothetical protein
MVTSKSRVVRKSVRPGETFKHQEPPSSPWDDKQDSGIGGIQAESLENVLCQKLISDLLKQGAKS